MERRIAIKGVEDRPEDVQLVDTFSLKQDPSGRSVGSVSSGPGQSSGRRKLFQAI